MEPKLTVGCKYVLKNDGGFDFINGEMRVDAAYLVSERFHPELKDGPLKYDPPVYFYSVLFEFEFEGDTNWESDLITEQGIFDLYPDILSFEKEPV